MQNGDHAGRRRDVGGPGRGNEAGAAFATQAQVFADAPEVLPPTNNVSLGAPKTLFVMALVSSGISLIYLVASDMSLVASLIYLNLSLI